MNNFYFSLLAVWKGQCIHCLPHATVVFFTDHQMSEGDINSFSPLMSPTPFNTSMRFLSKTKPFSHHPYQLHSRSWRQQCRVRNMELLPLPTCSCLLQRRWTLGMLVEPWQSYLFNTRFAVKFFPNRHISLLSSYFNSAISNIPNMNFNTGPP